MPLYKKSISKNVIIKNVIVKKANLNNILVEFWIHHILPGSSRFNLIFKFCTTDKLKPLMLF